MLKSNVVLNAWCLVCALVGTKIIIRFGRKPSAMACQFSLIVMMYIIGGLSKKYADNSDANITSSNALVYGNVAAICTHTTPLAGVPELTRPVIFQGFYSVVYTPILNLYPPEIMNFSMRANGFAFMQLTNNLAAVVLVYVMPIGM